jgi:hypothetical protein
MLLRAAQAKFLNEKKQNEQTKNPNKEKKHRQT